MISILVYYAKLLGYFINLRALTNIASGTNEHTELVIRLGAVELLVDILSIDDINARKQALWGLGNISGNLSECRDLVLDSGALNPILDILSDSSTSLSTLIIGTWTLSNLCRGNSNWNQVIYHVI